MTLSDWLTDNEVADAAFAARIGVSRQTLWRYKAGERTPRPAVMARIREETEGVVTPNDFMPASAATEGRAA